MASLHGPTMRHGFLGEKSKTVAVLGAGPGGLVAAKEMLAAGLSPTVFDKATSIGGLWGSHSHQLWPSLNTNLSRFTCCFSDLAWDADAPTFPSQKQMGAYLSKYAQAFIPPECFRLGEEITSVSRSGPSAQQWEVQWRSAAAADQQPRASATFDHVIVSTGFYSQPHVPTLPNRAGFRGQVLHSSGLGDAAAGLVGKRVAVVGGGHSGVEVAADLAARGADVTHVVPRPLWVAPRLLPLDAASPSTPFLPLDLVFYRRSRRKHQPPPQQQQQLPRSPEENRKANEGLRTLLGSGSLVPSPLPPPWTLDQVLDSSPQLGISDSYLGSYRNGRITITLGRVEDVSESSLLVRASRADGPGPGPLLPVEDLAAVVLCTGYKPSLGFLQPELLGQLGYDADDIFSPLLLHRNVFHPAAPGLAMVGMYRAPYFAVMELQAKWAAAVFSGALQPPSAHEQQRGIEREAAVKAQRPRPQFPHADYVGLADDLAALLPVADSAPPAAAAGASPGADPVGAIAEDVVLPGSFHGATAAAVAAAGVRPVVAAALRGRGAAAAIFRSLAGPWALTRRITSALPSSPSGIVTGHASFTPTTAAPDEWLYSERGTFTLSAGQRMQVWRKYVYTYDSTADQLSLFFAEGDARGLPFMALTLHPSGTAERPAGTPSPAAGGEGRPESCPMSARAGAGREEMLQAGAGWEEPASGAAGVGSSGEDASPESSESGGWVATGDHLCGRDMYRSTFRFVFSGAELSEVHQHVSVEGPEKDYVADSCYMRSSSASSSAD